MGEWSWKVVLAMRYLSTSEVPALHQTCIISKKSRKQEAFS